MGRSVPFCMLSGGHESRQCCSPTIAHMIGETGGLEWVAHVRADSGTGPWGVKRHPPSSGQFPILLGREGLTERGFPLWWAAGCEA